MKKTSDDDRKVVPIKSGPKTRTCRNHHGPERPCERPTKAMAAIKSATREALAQEALGHLIVTMREDEYTLNRLHAAFKVLEQLGGATAVWPDAVNGDS